MGSYEENLHDRNRWYSNDMWNNWCETDLQTRKIGVYDSKTRIFDSCTYKK